MKNIVTTFDREFNFALMFIWLPYIGVDDRYRQAQDFNAQR